MSTYNGRSRLNVSEYVAGLNMTPSTAELGQENFNIDDDLAMFTNTQFYDFDLGQDVTADVQPKFNIPEAVSPGGAAPAQQGSELKGMDFGIEGMS